MSLSAKSTLFPHLHWLTRVLKHFRTADWNLYIHSLQTMSKNEESSSTTNLLVTLANQSVAISWYILSPTDGLESHADCISQNLLLYSTVHLRFSLTQHHKRRLCDPSRSQCKFIKCTILNFMHNKHTSAASLIAASHCKSQYSNITWEKRTRSSIHVWKASELHYHLLEGTCISSNALSKSCSCTPSKCHRLCIQSTNHGIAHRINISQIRISTPKFGQLISHKAYFDTPHCVSHMTITFTLLKLEIESWS
jgi:hypothetical protein